MSTSQTSHLDHHFAIRKRAHTLNQRAAPNTKSALQMGRAGLRLGRLAEKEAARFLNSRPADAYFATLDIHQFIPVASSAYPEIWSKRLKWGCYQSFWLLRVDIFSPGESKDPIM